MTTRRTFSTQEKMEILNEGLQPGASAVEVCRKQCAVETEQPRVEVSTW